MATTQDQSTGKAARATMSDLLLEALKRLTTIRNDVSLLKFHLHGVVQDEAENTVPDAGGVEQQVIDLFPILSAIEDDLSFFKNRHALNEGQGQAHPVPTTLPARTASPLKARKN